MKRYAVTGMNCAACSARVERAVSVLDGVAECSVNLLTGDLFVSGDVAEEIVLSAVREAGYGITPKGADQKEQEVARAGREGRPILFRLILSLCLLLPLMYLSMGHAMLSWPLPLGLAERPLVIGTLQLVLSLAVMLLNAAFFVGGTRALLRGAPNMDTLVALGSFASFAYSTVLLFLMPGELHGLYFESAAMILCLITVGKLLEARAKGKATDAITALAALVPPVATLIRDGNEVTVPIAEVQTGDVFVLHPGDRVPVDGEVISGTGAVDEAALTGESTPVDKAAGAPVSAATVNLYGYLTCRATRVGEDTTLSGIIRMVKEAAACKAPIAKIADRVAAVFVPAVLVISLLTAVVWFFATGDIGHALLRAVSVLVISCPCSLGLATPVAIMVGSGVGAKHGILFKTAAALEETGRARTVLLDKTGTVTEGRPRTTDILPADGVGEEELLTLAYSLEKKSEHPLARAICLTAEQRGIFAAETENFVALAGNGVRADIDGKPLVGGSMAYVGEITELPAPLAARATSLADEGKTPLFFAENGRCLGLIAVADSPKEDAAAAIAALRAMGIRTVLLTGDNARTAEAIGRAVGVDEVIADVLPSGKEAVVEELQKTGKIIMVGDGINDAPALARADIGMAMGEGTDVAIDSADVVLVGGRSTSILTAVRLSRATLRNIRENLFWAFFYNCAGIPLAAGVFVPIFSWELSPMFAAAAMSLSSLFVVSNALRLNFFRSELKKSPKGETDMQRVIKIEGMMCPHCEAHVKAALEVLSGVESCIADHKAGTATLTFTTPLDRALLQKTVEGLGYKFLG